MEQTHDQKLIKLDKLIASMTEAQIEILKESVPLINGPTWSEYLNKTLIWKLRSEIEVLKEDCLNDYSNCCNRNGSEKEKNIIAMQNSCYGIVLMKIDKLLRELVKI